MNTTNTTPALTPDQLAKKVAEATRKMSKARSRLNRDAPFFGFISMALQLVERFDIPTGATDGTHLFFNPDYVLGCDMPELLGFVAEEVMHVAHGHHYRRGARDAERFNIACDAAIFTELETDGYFIPDGLSGKDFLTANPNARGKSAEAIYNMIPAPAPEGGDGGKPQAGQGGASGAPGAPGPSDGGDDAQGPAQGQGDAQGGQDGDGKGGGSGPDSGKGAGRPLPEDGGGSRGGVVDAEGTAPGGGLSDADRAKAQAENGAMLAQAVAVAKARGNLPGSAGKLLAALYSPAVDWQDVLRAFMADGFKDISDYTMLIPDMGTHHLGIYLPDLEYSGAPEIAFAIDTSGSIGQRELDVYASELNAIVEEFSPKRVHVLYCDTRVHDYDVFEKGEPVKLRKADGGGTCFGPVFDYLENLGVVPKLLVYCTDGWGDNPPAPDYPVMWCLNGDSDYCSATWGEKLSCDVKNAHTRSN